MSIYQKIEIIAFGLLEKNNLLSIPIDIETLATKMNIRIKDEPNLEKDDISGVLVIENNKGVIGIGINPKEGLQRRRFTIAHELGHFFLHHESKNLFLDDKIIFNRDNSSNTQEREANAFAASLLMPEEILKREVNRSSNGRLGDIEISNLAKSFDVSEIAMTFRLMNLELI